MSCVMNGKELGEWGYIKAEFDGPKTLWDEARLLKDAVFEYARFNYDFCSNNSDFPFGWGELQNQGILFHSFHHALKKGNYKELILPEHPYCLNKYQYREKSRSQRTDYWISLRKGKRPKEEIILLIEYGHEWVSVNNVYIAEDWNAKQEGRLIEKSYRARHWREDAKKLKTASLKSHRKNLFRTI